MKLEELFTGNYAEIREIAHFLYENQKYITDFIISRKYGVKMVTFFQLQLKSVVITAYAHSMFDWNFYIKTQEHKSNSFAEKSFYGATSKVMLRQIQKYMSI